MQSFFLYTNIGDSNKEGASEAGGRSTVRRTVDRRRGPESRAGRGGGSPRWLTAKKDCIEDAVLFLIYKHRGLEQGGSQRSWRKVNGPA